MMAAAMNPRAVAGIGDMFAGDVRIEQLIESHDGHAKRADEAEALAARRAESLDRSMTALEAVIAVMRRLDDDRKRDGRGHVVRQPHDFRSGQFAGSSASLASAVEQLRVALGLPSEWRDGGEG